MDPIHSFEWKITSVCNYNCEYCFSYKEGRHCSDETIAAVFDFLSKAREGWHVKLIGGEAMLHPRFFEICKRIVDYGCQISLTTNFSLPFSKFQELIEICGDKLEFLGASLHLSQIKDVNEFIEKATKFNTAKNPKTNFFITSVLRKETFEHLVEIEEKLKNRGIKLAFQIYRDESAFSKYDEKIEKYIVDKLERNTNTIRERDFFGTICYTGKWFFTISINGDVTRCFDSQPLSYLGNITKGTFRRFQKAKPCLSHRCSCPTPANRNMICYGKRASNIDIAKEYIKFYSMRFFRDTHRLVRYYICRLGKLCGKQQTL